MSRDHYKGVPKTRDARIGADGRLKPLNKVDTGPSPTFFNAVNVGTEAVKFRADGLRVDIYIDPINGKDTNSGLSAAQAIKTVDALQTRFPTVMLNGSRTVVNFINDTSSQIEVITEGLPIGTGEDPLNNSFVYRGGEMKLISPTTGAATAALDSTPAVRVGQDGIASGTGQRTRLDFTIASPGWTTNNFRKKFLRVTRAGSRVFHELPITGNTADTLFVDTLNVVGTLLASDTIEIVEPAVVLKGIANNFSILSAVGSNSTTLPNFLADEMGATFERLAFADIYTANIIGLQFDRCAMSVTGGSGSYFSGGSVSFVNCLSGWDLLYSSNNSYAPAARSDDAPISATAKVSLMVFNGSLALGTSGAVTGSVQPCSYTTNLPVGAYSNTGGQAPGIYVLGRNAIFMTTAAVTGDGNSGVGIHTSLGGSAYIPGGALCSITGAAGDLKVGTGAAISYGTAVGEFEEAAGYNGNFTRRLEGTASAPTGDDSVISSETLAFF